MVLVYILSSRDLSGSMVSAVRFSSLSAGAVVCAPLVSDSSSSSGSNLAGFWRRFLLLLAAAGLAQGAPAGPPGAGTREHCPPPLVASPLCRLSPHLHRDVLRQAAARKEKRRKWRKWRSSHDRRQPCPRGSAARTCCARLRMVNPSPPPTHPHHQQPPEQSTQ